MRRLKKTPPPVLVDDKKKKNKKNKRSQKKIVSKENKEPTIVKEKTKMYPSLELCQKLNRDAREVYELLMPFKLTKSQLKMNNFPSEDYHPQTLVDGNDRVCVRCNEQFEIFNGVYLCATFCKHHPRRATFSRRSDVKIYPCCNNPVGSDPCTVSNHHVTLQHGPRTMTKTASRRHIKKDLQFRIYALDCEMSYTTEGLEVTRIGVVDIDGCTVYDSYVKPKNKILDYNTLYSGVEKRHLEHVKITIDDVKEILNGFIHEDTILVGHALNNDLAALGLIHNTVVDTSVLYGNPNCPMKKRSLKALAFEHLGMTIQDNPAGHDCIEDARACLQLALLKVPPSPNFIEYENPASARPRRQSLAERENFFYENGNQQSSIGSREQQQPLMQLQNLYSYRNLAARAPNVLCNIYESDIFRFDPSMGCYRNYQIQAENSFTL
ncbi:putative exonuclease GOR isoform X2 [Argiope bruennichi]|uniref:putative exonuclease GOR isoform X2 n=1 Tax=Argiope bruennichi TaxID=94029 RepID=UPI0024942349|nr:putative exonuclease GOR isoform X2 [Argiope bruennichi]